MMLFLRILPDGITLDRSPHPSGKRNKAKKKLRFLAPLLASFASLWKSHVRRLPPPSPHALLYRMIRSLPSLECYYS